MTDRVIARGRKIEIHSPGAKPFRVRTQHTAYEWAMLYADRHPYPAWADQTLLRGTTEEAMHYREKMIRGEVKP